MSKELKYPKDKKYVVCSSGDNQYVFCVVNPNQVLITGLDKLEIFNSKKELKEKYEKKIPKDHNILEKE